MTERQQSGTKKRASRANYREFAEQYRRRRLDEADEYPGAKPPEPEGANAAAAAPHQGLLRGRRREYLRDYLRWLGPHRYAIAFMFALALVTAGLQMIEPLFMRFIVDRVLLNDVLATSERFRTLNLVGAGFLGVIALSAGLGVFRDYQQRLLNTRVMLTLRRALYDRMLHLPLAKLWDMKTGGILSRLTGDIDSTTGLLQMAILSPAISIIRLLIAVGILLALNWQLALVALAVIPGAMLMSFVSARRVRPIYRVIRKDIERIDGRVGETFSGIRVVRAFGREAREALNYVLGRHGVVRKELFAHRRELGLWTSWGFLVSGVSVVIVWYGGHL
jgi:ATP-binding cassette subfamily B protein/subfamily B ATP-binding cassette protein MsbA